MTKQLRKIKVSQGSELAQLLTQAEATPILLEKDGKLFRLEYLEKEPKDFLEGYDPEKVREAIAATAGSWAAVDTDKLIADIYRARKEGSRPAIRP